MSSPPLYQGRPDGFAIRPARATGARRVHERIWLSEGLSNRCLVVTDRGRVGIDTGMGFEAPAHRRNFDAVDRGPIR